MAQPIVVKFDGTNYSQWSFMMKIFLKGRGFWKYVTGDITCPIESGYSFTQWEIDNNKIMTWISNTVSTSINLQFSKFDTAKEIWDFFANRYNQTNFALKYKLELDIRNLKQQPGQSVADFHSQMSQIWDQLALMEPNWTHDAELYYKFREEYRLVQFLMALRDDFEFI